MEGDWITFPQLMQTKNFNPLPPHGGRRFFGTFKSAGSAFQSTPSAWRETLQAIRRTAAARDFNPLPPHGGRHFQSVVILSRHYFNPLPPHGGRQLVRFDPLNEEIISIHSLRMEGDSCNISSANHPTAFQSTPSAWRETARFIRTPICTENFNPLPPHGGRPHSESFCIAGLTFQSTPSAWRETFTKPIEEKPPNISIHSLRMEGDEDQKIVVAFLGISIHSLRMEGDEYSQKTVRKIEVFQSTPSAWRETEVMRRAW